MKMNKILSLYVAFVGKEGGKRRPVLIVENSENEIIFYSITSKCQNKSDKIKKLYFKINDWKDSNLKKESWIDIGTLFVLSKDKTDFEYKDIGELSQNDTDRLEVFLKNTLKR
ncbi:type II toxin-antitoxin system PemK/MazF family toxin [Enterococcus sp. OL5]|uniref:type II toxin-antitoxin system PemK/MazF family toxin n=1 Tax=Enterococcus sp. OL5 TaxID=2590214 RepID=UPI00112E67A7|nr:type II toxin-antitoxin system PemK/MazF family toxin [Enterococcus sp. OL5]TPR56907.1 type II toxin-antitoxin system PemK/MazF family toxin [Enterococcus sp. OL5]